MCIYELIFKMQVMDFPINLTSHKRASQNHIHTKVTNITNCVPHCVQTRHKHLLLCKIYTGLQQQSKFRLNRSIQM